MTRHTKKGKSFSCAEVIHVVGMEGRKEQAHKEVGTYNVRIHVNGTRTRTLQSLYSHNEKKKKREIVTNNVNERKRYADPL